uniref:AAA-ATPase-like domain-containing protein n=1 Tax=Graphocephala atropunctata TaxID=36148 RepID=A0A1B6MGY8_9HEMI
MQCCPIKQTKYFLLSLLFVSRCVCASDTSSKKNSGSNLRKVSDDFRSAVLCGVFVDKSILIHEILTSEERVFQITRPRKWGKSFNLDMLGTFFRQEFDKKGNLLSEETRANSVLFKGGEVPTKNGVKVLNPLKISRLENAMSRLGRHPVISLSLESIKGNSLAEIEESLKCKVVKLFSDYPFLDAYLGNVSDILDENEKQRLDNFISGNFEGEYVFDCLEFLSMLLYEHFHSYVCLFIDNYDLPIVNTFMKFGDRSQEFEYVVEIFRRLYEYTFKENQYLLKGVITGTLNFDLVPSGASEFQYRYISYNTVLDGLFSKYYGFTLEEIKDLLRRTNSIWIEEFREWYGGCFYNGVEIYNPGSVMKYFSRQEHYNYYLNTCSKEDIVSFLEKAFLEHSMQEFLLLLAEGKEIIRHSLEKSVSLRNLAEDFYSVFVHAGYLNLIPPERVTEKPIWRMNVPNLEIRGVFASGFKMWICREFNISNLEFEGFTDLLATKEVDRFAVRLQELLSTVDKYGVKAEEHCYHMLMGSLAASLGSGCLVDSIKELGQSRGENVIIPLIGFGELAINIEYSVCKPWQNIQNIVNASLTDLLHRPRICSAKIRAHKHVREILYVSVGFCGPKVAVKYKVVSA